MAHIRGRHREAVQLASEAQAWAALGAFRVEGLGVEGLGVEGLGFSGRGLGV